MFELRAKNHFVSESYLKRWLGPEQKLCAYRLLVSHKDVPLWRATSPAGTGYQKHLYTQILSGEDSDNFERWISSEFEDPAIPVIDKVLAEKKLVPEDWEKLIKFLALSDLRTLYRLREHFDFAQKTMPGVLDDVLRDLDKKLESNDSATPLKSDELSEFAELFPLRITTKIEDGEEMGIVKAETYPGRASWINGMRYLLKKTRHALHQHKWTIIKPAKGYTWFTSDNPVIKLNWTSEFKYDLRGGWGKKNGNIIFPLGPEHAMFVQIGDRPWPKGKRLTPQKTNQVRQLIAENAYRTIYSHTKDAEVPLLAPRIVDEDRYKAEKKELDQWHANNSAMEMSYLAANKQAQSS